MRAFSTPFVPLSRQSLRFQTSKRCVACPDNCQGHREKGRVRRPPRTRRCRRPMFIQPMVTRLDLTAAGVGVYCRSACSFEFHFYPHPTHHHPRRYLEPIWVSSPLQPHLSHSILPWPPQSRLLPIFPVLHPDHILISRTERFGFVFDLASFEASFFPERSYAGTFPVDYWIPVILKVAGPTRMLERVRS